MIKIMRLIVRNISQRLLGSITCLIVLVCAGSTGRSQTPWEAAPARPAEVPVGNLTIPSRVASLPAPPVRAGAKPLGNAGAAVGKTIHTPVSVPLQRPTYGQQAESLIPGDSLIPDPMGLPPIPPRSFPVASFPQSGKLAFPPLPSPSDPTRSQQNALLRQTVQTPSGGGVKSLLVSFEPSVHSQSVSEPFAAGKLVAVVGTEHLLAGDMAIIIEPIIEQNRDRIRSSSDEEQMRIQLTRQLLPQFIEVKALKLEFFRDMGGVSLPEEAAAMKKQIVTRAGRIFYEKQAPELIKKYKVNSLSELEEKLRAKSMSLGTLKSQFVEQVLSQELERKYVPMKYEISLDNLYRDYQQNRSDWNVPAKARWRQITVRFDKHNQDRSKVDSLIKSLGNQVFLGGKPFESVAKQSSEGYTAQDGGIYDWTTRGSLRSKPIDQAIFSLPLQQMSKVIVDDIGMHIVEVMERVDGHTKDFATAQSEIRNRLSDEKRELESEKFRSKVLARTPVWSLWPEDLKAKIKHVRPLSEALGEGLDEG